MNEKTITVFEKKHGFNKGGFSDREKFHALRSCTSGNYMVAIRNKSKCVRGGGRNSSPDSRQEWDNVYDSDIEYRKLTVVECCRLQSVPDDYFKGIVSNSQAYKCLGNGWQVDTIVHIFQYLKADK